MTRVDKIFALAKGYRGRAKNCLRTATQRVEKGLQYAYRDRRNKKRDFRSLWIQRINAGAREHSLSYSHLMEGLKNTEVRLNRKMLSELAVAEPYSFRAVCEHVKQNSSFKFLGSHFNGNRGIVTRAQVESKNAQS